MDQQNTQEIIYGLEFFEKDLVQLTFKFQNMQEELRKGIDELLQFVNKWRKTISEEKQTLQKPLKFYESLQKQISTFQNQISEQISSIQKSDYFIWLGEQCYEQCEEEIIKGKLDLIDDLLTQEDYCLTIAFNCTGTIMVSGCGDKVKLWDFDNGKIKEIATLNLDEMQIMSLIFSKNSESFLSGGTNSINMWQQAKNLQNWQNVNQICNAVYCMILNQKETKLYTGGDDLIIVWDINFENQKLQFQKNLPIQNPYSLSLNEDETFLAACSADNSIYIWEIKKQAINLYQIYDTNQLGHNLCFINNTQFIWLPAEQDKINCVYVYDLQNGIFQQQVEKQIALNYDDTCYDSQFFPIVYNKERNIIALRHKITVYLLQVLSNGKIKIITQVKFETDEIYGSMTNNGRNLVLWDKSSMKYSIYEIEIQ